MVTGDNLYLVISKIGITKYSIFLYITDVKSFYEPNIIFFRPQTEIIKKILIEYENFWIFFLCTEIGDGMKVSLSKITISTDY